MPSKYLNVVFNVREKERFTLNLLQLLIETKLNIYIRFIRNQCKRAKGAHKQHITEYTEYTQLCFQLN